MKYEIWNQRATPNGEPLLDAVLRARGIDAQAQRQEYLNPRESRFSAPLLLKDMDKAVARIEHAIAAEEPIAIYGDYDVDGITATALLTLYFQGRGVAVTPYIPDRIEEGYGLNSGAIEALARQGVKLIITVDCGITAVEEIELARALGVEVVITDHHSCKERLPAAAAVVNPQRQDCAYPFRALAGVAVAWKLAVALAGDQGAEVEARFLSLAALGTVADAMPLVGENRTIVARGLPLLPEGELPGLRALLEEAGRAGKPMTTMVIGFHLAPRINAAGRMGKADLALELLLTRDAARAELLSKELCELNTCRQQVEQEIYEQCVAQAETMPPDERGALVLAHTDWHQGVVGIVASRLAEKYAAPVFIVSLAENGRGKGSCRTYAAFHLFSALEQCSDLLEGFGGHEFAAGFTILEAQIPALRRRLNEIVCQRSGGEALSAVLEVDLLLPDFSQLTLEETEALEAMEPCGTGNPKPVLMVQAAQLANVRVVSGGRHLRFRATKGRRTLDGIFFGGNLDGYDLAPGQQVDIAFTPKLNTYNGTTSVQLQVDALRPSPTRAQQERALLDRFLAGEALTEAERTALRPGRAVFADVWRYISGRGHCEESERDFVKNVSKTRRSEESLAQILLALVVLQERGLVTAELERGRVKAAALRVDGKVDLEESPLLQRLNAGELAPV